MTAARFVGIGVSEYDKGHVRLARAVLDVEDFAGLLPEAFESTLLPNPDEQAARDCLRQLRGSMPDGGALVLLWDGTRSHRPQTGFACSPGIAEVT